MTLFNSKDLTTAEEKFEELKSTGKYHWLILSEYFERYVGWENEITESYHYYIYDGEDGEHHDDNHIGDIGYHDEVIKVYDGRAFMRDKQIDEILN